LPRSSTRTNFKDQEASSDQLQQRLAKTDVRETHEEFLDWEKGSFMSEYYVALIFKTAIEDDVITVALSEQPLLQY
jgi:hypothetical protein